MTVDNFLHGDQPLCAQHRDKLEADLQRWMLGIDRFIVPSSESLRKWGEAGSRCSALVIDGDDLPEDLSRCEHRAVLTSLYGEQPLTVPLCSAHAAALAWAMRASWNELLRNDVRPAAARPGWGWMMARDFNLEPSVWQWY